MNLPSDSFGFRSGVLYGCLENQKYDPQKNKQEENMQRVAFCLCILEEILNIAIVEGSQVVLPRGHVFAMKEKCIDKVRAELFTSMQ